MRYGNACLSDNFGTFVLSHLSGFLGMPMINNSGSQQSLRRQQELQERIDYVRLLVESVGMSLC